MTKKNDRERWAQPAEGVVIIKKLDERRTTPTGAVQRGDWGARVAPAQRKGWERD